MSGPPAPTRVVVAMSGGVDSSVAAALLRESGHDVIGLSMQLYDQRDPQASFGSCCTIDDLHDARRAAQAIGIPHYIVNLEAAFEQHVVSNFVNEYVGGRTPIPCVHCNGRLKFTQLLDRARGLGTPRVATGHYARIDRDATTGRLRLRRGVDPDKDQSYFLFSLSQAQLASAEFPVGGLTKQAVRDYARARGLPVADKPDSHELCFVASGDHPEFVERRAPSLARGGPITDRGGRVLGRHDGIHRYTVGQRRGLGLSGPAPLYVLAIDPASQAVVVGPRDALERTTLTASQVSWVAGEAPTAPLHAAAQIRHRHRAAPACITALPGGQARVEFDEPQTAVAPGQAVVFFLGEDVLGGGWIDS